MTTRWLIEQVQNIIADVGGNPEKAARRLVDLSLTDHRLLLALTEPYLKAIAAHAVDRLGKAPKDGLNPVQFGRLVDALADSMGQDDRKAAMAAKRQAEAAGAHDASIPTPGSARHAATIRALAAIQAKRAGRPTE